MKVTDFFKGIGGAFSMLTGGTPWRKAMLAEGFDIPDDKLKPLFNYLEFCLKQIVADNVSR